MSTETLKQTTIKYFSEDTLGLVDQMLITADGLLKQEPPTRTELELTAALAELAKARAAIAALRPAPVPTPEGPST